jgi:hypothetical protein
LAALAGVGALAGGLAADGSVGMGEVFVFIETEQAARRAVSRIIKVIILVI